MKTNIFFTSDWHLGHHRIISYVNRPFKDVHEMDREIIKRHNSKVQPGDLVYHLGDFSLTNSVYQLAKYLSLLNGNIYLIRGNHDRKQTIKKLQEGDFPKKFVWIRDFAHLKLNKNQSPVDIILMHYAMRVWPKSHYGSIHLYGHSHNSLPPIPRSRSMDIGVDTNDFYPYSLEEIKNKLLKLPGHIIDHHKRRIP